MTLTAQPPVFIYGALRSGTTLFRLMLASHPKISNPGEVDFLFDYLSRDATHPTGWRYAREDMRTHRIFKAYNLHLPDDCDGLDLLAHMIDQLRQRDAGVLTMNIHRNADLAMHLLPQARFIHLLRDPRDVARSSIGMGWSGTSYHGVHHWIVTLKDWEAARTNHPQTQICTITFEDMMTNIEKTLKQVCQFLDIEFSPSMLDYHLETTYGPPDPTIAQQWRRKADPHEIALIEGRCGDLLRRCGYTANGEPRIPGRSEETFLKAKDRILRWRFNIRRFGLPLFLGAHLTKLIGLRSYNAVLRQRMDQIVIKALK